MNEYPTQKDFNQAVDADTIRLLSQASLEEAQSKEERLRAFYQDPYEDGSERWFMPEFAFDFMREYKPPGKKRKDNLTEDALHEINPCLNMKGYFKGNILPPAVTYQIVGGQRFDLPREQQHIQLIFALEKIHDLDEDFPEVSPDLFVEYMSDRILSCQEMPSHERDLYIDMIDPLKQGLIAITLNRKTYADDGITEIEIETHQGDPHICFDELEKLWFAGGVKGPDRLSGTIQRFSHIPNQFPIDAQIDYAIDIRSLFMHRLFLETMATRYPQLSEFLNIVNSQLRVAYVCFDAMVGLHPENPRERRKGKYSPQTARIDIAKFLPDAFKGSEFIDKDTLIFDEMLKRMAAEASHYLGPNSVPILQPLVDQMEGQIRPYLEELKNPTGELKIGLSKRQPVGMD